MANIRGSKKEDKQRIAIISAFPQAEPMTGYNVALRICNDQLTQEDIQAGKGQSAPMLVYRPYTDAKTGEQKTGFTASYSKEQYEAMMAVANTDGTHPVFDAQVFPRQFGDESKGLLVNTKAMAETAIPYDHAKDIENTNAIRELKEANKEAGKAAPAAEVEAQVEAEAQAEGPEL